LDRGAGRRFHFVPCFIARVSGSVGRSLYTHPIVKKLARYLSGTDSLEHRRQGIQTMHIVFRFLRDETAATAIEYGLIAAGISLAIIAVVNGLGSKLNTKFTAINTSLK
jgi:pilus assembly protein Flp/PilA